MMEERRRGCVFECVFVCMDEAVGLSGVLRLMIDECVEGG